MLNGETAYVNGKKVTGNIPSRTSSNVTASGATVTIPAGHYASQVTKSVTTASRASTTISTTANDTNDTLTYTASNNQSTGYVTGANKTATKTVTLTTSGATATMSDGTNSVSKSVTTANRAATTMTTTADDTNDKLTITASNNQSTGYVTGSNQTATKTITLTASGSSVTASDGSTSVSKSVATATQATPSVSIDANGKITASATQTAGYVSAGTKSATPVNLTTKAATTITPTKSAQTAVAKNVYTTGAITVAAIPDQYQDITTPLAELNAANGGTVASTINSAVDNTEAHASSQEAMIAQITQALEGKIGEATVLRNIGTFTISDEAFSVNVGFQPDLVLLHVGEDDGGYNKMHAAAAFYEDTRDIRSVYTQIPSANGWYAFYIRPWDSGFAGNSWFVDSNFSWNEYSTPVSYVAVKYT